MDFPKKAKFPGKEKQVCFTSSAARAASQARMREQVEKIEASVVKLRRQDFPTMKCAICRYFLKDQPPENACKIVTRAEPELVCDAYQGADPRKPTYEVADKDWLAFVDGMVKEQPYQHVVKRGFLTPEGPIVIIADTMEPKPHIFSLSKAFHLAHTGSEHGWTQDEVDKLIQVKKPAQEQAEPKDGLVMVQPAAEKIVSGDKTVVVESQDIGINGEPMFLVSRDVVLGVIQLDKPRKVDLTEFRTQRNKHRVSERERMRDWPNAKTLWLYKIRNFEAFDEPRQFKRPQGQQTVIKDVKFVRAACPVGT